MSELQDRIPTLQFRDMNSNTSKQQRFFMALLLSMGVGLLYAQYFIFEPPSSSSKNGQAQEEQAKKEKLASSNSNKPQTQKQSTQETDDSKNEINRSTNKETPPTSENNEAISKDHGKGVSNGKGPAPEASETPDYEKSQQESYPSEYVIENDEVKITFSTNSATVQSYTLKNYYETASHKYPLNIVPSPEKGPKSFSISSPENTLKIQSNNWRPVKESHDQNKIAFQQTNPSGLTVRKTFTLPNEDPFMLDYSVDFQNSSQIQELGQIRLYGTSGISLVSKQDIDYHYAVQGFKTAGEWTFRNEPTAQSIKEKLKNNETLTPKDVKGPTWIGVTNKYFTSAMIASDHTQLVGYQFTPVELQANVKSRELADYSSLSPYYITNSLSLSPDESQDISFRYFIGPKDQTLLQKYKMLGLTKLNNYGWFGFISKLLLAILDFFYALIGNYGLSIIFLTVLVKACLHPLIRKSHVSMHKMKELQPKIEKLKEKYEDDKQKLGEKQMELFKEHGVNPLGGCLPMALQMPVLLGLYWGIRQSFSLRQQPFFGWINDLSRPDQFMELPFTAQFFGISFEYLNLLVVFMMITWLVQSFTQPTPSGGNETAQMQSKMMKFIPLVFGILFYNFPSGLVLYWFTNTLFSTIEQLYIRQYVMPST